MISPVTSAGHQSASPASQAKLKSAAQEFESMLLSDLLKLAESDKASDETGIQGYDDMRIQAISSGLAANGGIGIAQLLLRQLSPPEPAPQINAFSSAADSSIAGRNK